MSKSNLKHLEKIEDSIKKSKIDHEKKALAVKKIEEWYAEDKGMDLLVEQLINITKEIEPILKEIGLV